MWESSETGLFDGVFLIPVRGWIVVDSALFDLRASCWRDKLAFASPYFSFSDGRWSTCQANLSYDLFRRSAPRSPFFSPSASRAMGTLDEGEQPLEGK